MEYAFILFVLVLLEVLKVYGIYIFGATLVGAVIGAQQAKINGRKPLKGVLVGVGITLAVSLAVCSMVVIRAISTGF